MLTTMRTINKQPQSCGVAVYPAHLWWLTGGYSALRPGLPLYGIARGTALTPAEGAAFSNIITTSEPIDPLPAPDFTAAGFHPDGCLPNAQARSPVCLWRRTGPCNPSAAKLLDAPGSPELGDIEKAAIERLRR
jgi:hypothetical protein